MAKALSDLPPCEGHARPYALVLGFADSFADRTIRIGGATPSSLLVEDYVSRPGWPSTSGPFVFLGVIGPSRLHPGTMACRSAALLPIVSRETPLPVESNHERAVAQSLVSTIVRHRDRWPDLTLQKPLYAEMAGDTVVRSDYIVSCGSLRLHVEVLGFDRDSAPEYHRRKNKQEQALMAGGAVTHSVHAHACRSHARWASEFERLTKATEEFIRRNQPARPASARPWPPDPELMWKPLQVLETDLPDA
jgi:hypothetical protein